LEGRGFSERAVAPYVPDAIRTPMYPFFLATSKGLTGSYDPSLFISVLLGATIPLAGMLLLTFLGRRSSRELLIVGGLLSIEPHLVHYSLIYGSEAIFLPLVAWAFVAGVAAFARPDVRVGAVAGALFGVAVLARPIVQFFPFLIALFLIVRWRKDPERKMVARKTAAVLLVAYAVVVSPWIIRNLRTHGVADFSNVGWFNMYTRVAATTYAIEHGQQYDPTRIQFLQRLHEKGYIEKSPVTEQDVHGYAWKKIFQKETLETIKMYPKSFVISQISSFSTVISQDFDVCLSEKDEFGDVSVSKFLSDREALARWAVRNDCRDVEHPFLAHRDFDCWTFCLADSFRIKPVVSRDRLEARSCVFSRSFFFLSCMSCTLLHCLLNAAAAQSDARYRTQFIFVELPLAFYALIGMTRSRRSVSGEPNPSCPVCESRSEVRAWGMKRTHQMFQCRMCHARFVFPRPSSEELKAFYSDVYFFGGGAHGGYVDYDADKQAAHDSLISFLQKLERWVPEKGALLDVGAATGSFLEVAKERGWKVFGHEISEDAAGRARKKRDRDDDG
jgi:hypothetical protein